MCISKRDLFYILVLIIMLCFLSYSYGQRQSRAECLVQLQTIETTMEIVEHARGFYDLDPQ